MSCTLSLTWSHVLLSFSLFSYYKITVTQLWKFVAWKDPEHSFGFVLFFFFPSFCLWSVVSMVMKKQLCLVLPVCSLPSLLSIPFFFNPFSSFPSLLHLSARCVSSATSQPTSHLHRRRRVGDGDQRRAQWQPANVQAGSGGGWWRWKERPHHPIFPEDLRARLRPHHRGLVPQTHRDRRAVGDTGWWVESCSFSLIFSFTN